MSKSKYEIVKSKIEESCDDTILKEFLIEILNFEFEYEHPFMYRSTYKKFLNEYFEKWGGRDEN